MRNILLGFVTGALGQCIQEGYIIDVNGNCVCGAAGYVEQNGTCQAMEQCTEFNPCDEVTQECTPSVNGPECTCTSGFETAVDGGCVDIDECDMRLQPNPCPFDRPNCVNIPGSYTCQSKQCEKGTHLEYGVCMDIGNGSRLCLGVVLIYANGITLINPSNKTNVTRAAIIVVMGPVALTRKINTTTTKAEVTSVAARMAMNLTLV